MRRGVRTKTVASLLAVGLVPAGASLHAQAPKRRVIGMSQCNLGEPWRQQHDPGAHGAWLAARAAGREGEMRFVGIDALSHEGLRYVRQGVLDATFEYPTGGAEAIQAALRIFAGEGVEQTIVLGSRLYTRENVDAGGAAVPAAGNTTDKKGARR